jgi:glycosyltransferase involved in cell wall biosynthesis
MANTTGAKCSRSREPAVVQSVECGAVETDVKRVSPPRVALCFGTYPPDRNGGADFIARFAGALADAGATVSVITSSATFDGAQADHDRVTVHRVVDDWTIGRAGRSTLRRLSRIVEEEADILHVFFPDSVLQARYQIPALIGARHMPLVSTFWNLGLGRGSPWPLKLEALALLARSRVVTSHDPRYLATLRRLVGWARPVEWLPVGNNVGPASGEPPEVVRSRHGIGSEPLIGYFGALDETRGLEDLFEAFSIVHEVSDARLVMIGSGGRRERYRDHAGADAAYGRYTELPRQLGIDHAVMWTPYLRDDEAASLLAALDVCALPFRRNSLGRSSLAAALSVGTPIVLGGAPSDVEPLRDGVDVALVPRRDPRQLAATLLAVLADGDRREHLRRGSHDAAHWFQWPAIAKAALAIYDRALGGGERRSVSP